MAASTLEQLLGALDEPNLPPGRKTEDVTEIHQRRLMAAVLKVVGDKGYHETTLADIVREARVSRRTFYLFYATKQECLFAACDAVIAAVLEQMAEVARKSGASGGRGRLLGAFTAYLRAALADPSLLRVFYFEIGRAGPEGMARHREFQGRWAAALRYEVKVLRRVNPEIAAATTELSEEHSLAIIGAVPEMVGRLLESESPAAGVPAVRRVLVTMVLGAISEQTRDWTQMLEGDRPA
jgi:AcrR family transcriptional regulator